MLKIMFSRKFLTILLFNLIILLIVLFGLLLWTNRPSASPFTTRMSQQTVIKELRALNRYETAAFTIEKVIDAGTNGNIFKQLLFGDKILLIAHGEVIAGFDFSTLADDAITVSGSDIRLTLPAPEILLTRLDNKETRVYDRRRGLLNQENKDLESEARLTAEEAIEAAACTGGILNEASKNARSNVTAILKTAGFTTVAIEIPEGSC